MPLGVAHTPLRDQIREQLRKRIIDGRLPPGTRLVERELAAELGVSRVPVREAVRMLDSEGFVQVVPRRGVVVKQLSRTDVEELFDVRESLEVLATRRAAENSRPADLRRLAQHLKKARRALDAGKIEQFGDANEAFHDEIIALARNHLLAGMLEPLQGRLHWLFRQIDNPESLWEEHQRLYNAIASGDPELATTQALSHVRINRDIAMRLLFDEPTQDVLDSPA
ncbi:MAG: FCD domain-containing protein [Actinophytocola sp.]|nr:FCD domain-containing protein [Actinophytocola sp.]